MSYDAWGNVTSRTYAGMTATLTYDVLDHLVAWNAGSTNQEWYAYDVSGNRVLRRSTTGSGTSITTYAFGLEEHLYGATGINTGNTYYYYLGGRLIGDLTGITTLTTQFFLTDALGSVLATFSAIAGSAAVLGNQIYGPYGNQRYTKGPLGTAKGYTGQYADATGLDYYNARYYDPAVGRFVSADTVQGNEQGMDPYAYVGGNPESRTDPTGNHYACNDSGGGCGGPSGGGGGAIDFQPPRQNNGGNTGGGSGTMRPTPTPTPTPRPVQHNHQPSGGNACNSRCGTDKILIKNHYTKEKAKTQSMWDAIGDGVSLVGDFLALAADWGNDWADFFFTAATSLLPHILALIVDITKATGGTPPRWLSDITGYAKFAVAFLNGLRPVLRFLDPTAGIFGTIKDWIVHETKHALTEAIGLAISGAGAPGISAFSKQSLEDHYNDINNQVDGYLPDYAYQQCQHFYAHQNVQC